MSLIVPAFNEERRLGGMLDAYLPFLEKRYGDRVEVLVVVNGSTDGTESVARSYGEGHPILRVLVEPRSVGKGAALMMGFAEARGDRVGFVDADGATPPEALEDLVLNMGDAGVILASRWHPASRIQPQPLSRRVASRGFNALVRLLFRLPISDTQCGAKVLSREAVQAILPKLGVTRWAFDVDLLFQARRAGFRIVEAPTVWNDQAGSRLRVGRASLEMLLAMVRLRLLYSRMRFVVGLYDRNFGKWVHRNRG
ncbi:MAG: dolichyl-phosphate beta-glucosyltransferase [Kiritimatiellia bacterium]|nr:dolichyl-phosphate beta-glucosyltransferase [Kiritimatiellia bacterium]